MKAQKLGLVLGMNMAVACMVLQGCKANKPGGSTPPTTPGNSAWTTPAAAPATTGPSATTTIATIDQPETTVSTTMVSTYPTETAPVELSSPSQVTTVKPLPPEGKKPATPKKPAATTTVAATSAAGAPATTAGSVVYTVKPGDQLFALSRRYNVKMSAIEKANPGLNPNKIRVGQKITIPGAASATAVAAAPAPAKDAKVTTMQASAPAPVAANTTPPTKTKSSFKSYTGPTKEYKVKSGDTLGKIAYENGISIRALKELNKLTKDTVRVGQTLLIPAEKVVAAAASTTKPADAKKPSAKKPATTPVATTATATAPAPAPAPTTPAAATTAPEAPAAEPAAAVESPVVPEPVVAPAPAPATGPTYTVKENDDLVSVAIAWGISPSVLMDLNDLKAGDSLTPGQVLKLPATAKQSAQ